MLAENNGFGGNHMRTLTLLAVLASLTLTQKSFAVEDNRRWVNVAATANQITECGLSVEAIRTGSVWGFAHPRGMECLRKKGYKILSSSAASVARGGHISMFGFPPAEDKFHDYKETEKFLKDLARKYAHLARVSSIGKSYEGNRDIWALQINSSGKNLQDRKSGKPGIVFMGNHHAREHVSNEIPLMLAEYLLKNQKTDSIRQLLNTRDIWFIPMVNPDGVEYDIAAGTHRYWRKNRRDNGDGNYGVDLNRNYGWEWRKGRPGASDETDSEVFRGTAPFSEPETQVVRDFVKARPNLKILLSFHTFSELILYPWGYTEDKITTRDPKTGRSDLDVYQDMAETMAKWNHYKPEQSSDLYISNGDTTDWAWGELGIFSFTFELSPRDQWSGGFYPGQDIIDKVFEDNIKPSLYLIEKAADPYGRSTGASRFY